MLTSQGIAVATAMKLASDGKQDDPTGLLIILGIMALVFIVTRIVEWWRWK